MKFLANENFPGDAVEALRGIGHDVLWVLVRGRAEQRSAHTGQRGSPLLGASPQGALTPEVKDIQNHESPTIEEHDVSANDNVRAFGWRRRQIPYEVLGAGHNFPPQARRERTAHAKLPFQPRR
jgi:hypothetical protein